jgi:hypothetical protein
VAAILEVKFVDFWADPRKIHVLYTSVLEIILRVKRVVKIKKFLWKHKKSQWFFFL